MIISSTENILSLLSGAGLLFFEILAFLHQNVPGFQWMKPRRPKMPIVRKPMPARTVMKRLIFFSL
jgi:hypothetical protein